MQNECLSDPLLNLLVFYEILNKIQRGKVWLWATIWANQDYKFTSSHTFWNKLHTKNISVTALDQNEIIISVVYIFNVLWADFEENCEIPILFCYL